MDIVSEMNATGANDSADAADATMPDAGGPFPSPAPERDLATLEQIVGRVRWLSAAMVDAANAGRPNESGVKVGGHQASSASMVEIMVALWFSELSRTDRVSVKPHASPVLHAVNYLLDDLDEAYLPTLRAKGGLQSYPPALLPKSSDLAADRRVRAVRFRHQDPWRHRLLLLRVTKSDALSTSCEIVRERA